MKIQLSHEKVISGKLCDTVWDLNAYLTVLEVRKEFLHVRALAQTNVVGKAPVF